MKRNVSSSRGELALGLALVLGVAAPSAPSQAQLSPSPYDDYDGDDSDAGVAPIDGPARDGWAAPSQTAEGETPRTSPDDPDGPSTSADDGLPDDEPGDDASLGADEEYVEPFTPDEALQEYVSVATKFTFTAQRTPANVTVISRQDIERSGWRSVGEALATVPGLFMSYDLQNYHVGVRGLFGGARSGSRLLRIMVDGRPIAFVQAGTYLLGPEFVPMSAIERIEVMRGPASALYGAGALTGAINVVTRRPSFTGSTALTGQLDAYGGALGQTAGGGDGTLALTGDGWYLTGGVSGAYEDRSGLTLPASCSWSSGAGCPFNDSYLEPDGTPRRSRRDIATPISIFARGGADVAGGQLSAMFVGQLSERTAEFHDLSVLSNDGTRDTRVSLYSVNASLGYERPFANGVFVRALAGYAQGGPTRGDQYYFPDRQRLVTRDFASRELTGTLELLWEYVEGGLVMVGVDGQYDAEEPQTLTIRDTTTGAANTNLSPARQTLGNVGVYAQLLWPVAPQVVLSGGVRLDYNSVVNDAVSARLAAVWSPSDQVSFKLLFGRSFKAPSPEQLYNVPISDLDVHGDQNLTQQYLNNVELSGDFFPTRNLRFTLAAFYNNSQDGLAYVTRRGTLVAQPTDAQSVGGESTIRLAVTEGGPVAVDLGANVSIAYTKTEESLTAGLPTKYVPDNETYPLAMAGAFGDLRIPDANLGFRAMYRFVGARTPSQTNLIAQGSDAFDPGYSLDPYHVLDAVVSYGPVDLGALSLTLMLSMQNILDQRFAAVGFNGVDVPTVGRTGWLRARVEF